MKLLEDKTKLIEMRAKGFSYDAIAKEIEVSKPTLIDWTKNLENEIAKAKAIELEALYEQFYLHKEARIRSIGGVLKKILEELETRSLADVPTDKLMEIFAKYYQLIKEEYTEPVFISSKDIEEIESLDSF